MSAKAPMNTADQRFNDIVARFASELRELMAAQVLEAVRHSVSEIMASGFARSVPASSVATPQKAELGPANEAKKLPAPVKKAEPKKPSPAKKTEAAGAAKAAQAPSAAKATQAPSAAKAAKKTGTPGPVKATKKTEAAGAAKAAKVAKQSSAQNETQKGTLTTRELKRIAGTKPVACPAPNCTNPGVRRFSNFCFDHHASLSKADQKRLRDAQRKTQTAGAQPQPQGDQSAPAA